MTAVLEGTASLAAAVRLRRQQLDRQAGQAEQLAAQISATEAELAGYRALAELNARAGALLTTIGEETQETARGKVQELATRALQVVFGPEHEFLLKPGERGGQATLELLVRSRYPNGTVVETGVLEARGGGMAAVIGYVLRLVVLLLTPDLANVLFLDETFAHVSARLRGAGGRVHGRGGAQGRGAAGAYHPLPGLRRLRRPGRPAGAERGRGDGGAPWRIRVSRPGR